MVSMIRVDITCNCQAVKHIFVSVCNFRSHHQQHRNHNNRNQPDDNAIFRNALTFFIPMPFNELSHEISPKNAVMLLFEVQML